jgi:Ankyrin repeats (3 copies)
MTRGGSETVSDEVEVFEGLRAGVLGLEPASVGLAPSSEHPWLWGVVMDMDVGGETATLASLVDGTTSMYLSTGGGTIGAGAHRDVADATDRLIRVAERHLGLFDLAEDLSLPGTGQVRITALGYSDRRSVVAVEVELGEQRHPLSPVFHAAHAVISEIRLLSDPDQNRRPYRQPDGTTALMASAFQGRTDVVAQLLGAGYSVDEADDVGQTALMYAANGGQPGSVRLLLDAGANPLRRDQQGNDALMFAAQHGHTDILGDLLTSGSDPTTRGSHGLTAMGLAKQNGHRSAVTLLHKQGGSI